MCFVKLAIFNESFWFLRYDDTLTAGKGSRPLRKQDNSRKK